MHLFDSFVPHTYRVTNKKDIVPRLPRSSKANLLRYEHVGKTVMLDEDGLGSLWIEGESAGISSESLCCTRNRLASPHLPCLHPQQVSVLWTMCPHWTWVNCLSWTTSRRCYTIYYARLPLASTDFFSWPETIQVLTQAVSAVTDFDMSEKQLQAYPEQARQLLAQFAGNFTANALSSEFLDRELSLASTLLSGAAIEHHLEPSYFSAYEVILTRAFRRDTAGGGS